jgi:4-hydroxy-3-polyprenylbenzoate decarboxylase
LHFQTATTIDTLDYSAGEGLNSGSKLVIAAAGPKRRELGTQVPAGLKLPDGFTDARVALPGILCVSGPRHTGTGEREYHPDLVRLCDTLVPTPLDEFPLVVLVDDAEFAARTLNNFLWVTFTRSNPAADVLGVHARTVRKHFGCRGPLVIDARVKPHMAPPLVEDPAVSKRVDELAARGGPLHGLLG